MGARTSTFRPELDSAAEEATPEGSNLLPARVWSPQQEAVFEWFRTGSGNLVVRARAGTGKTTTIIEAVRYAPEEHVLLTAFNKAIAEELNNRLPEKAEAKTLHGVGMRYISRHYRRIKIADKGARARHLAEMMCGTKPHSHLLNVVGNLHTKARELRPLDCDFEGMVSILEEYNLGLDQPWGKYTNEWLCEKAMECYEHAANNVPDPKVGVDFADMIFLPLRHNLLSRDYPMIVVDETQDMNPAQLAMVQRLADGRICIVGDDRQAIYGFRGAAPGAMEHLKAVLMAKELPLTVTYRCGHNIVAAAQKLVPDIEAYATNQAGTVTTGSELNILEDAAPGDFILSRLNAPLAQLCLALLARKKRARIKGRDISDQILKILKKLKVDVHTPMEEVYAALADYRSKKVNRLLAFGDPEAAERVRDNCDVLYSLMDGCTTVSELLSNADVLFTESVSPADTILLSSVHKAKGLEADRVFLLDDTLYRFEHTREEENIEYVAITRAKALLVRVSANYDRNYDLGTNGAMSKGNES